MSKRTIPLLALALIALALAAAGCGEESSDDAASEPAAAPADDTLAAEQNEPAGQGEQKAEQKQKPEKQEPKGTTIKLAGSQFGEVLFDGGDQAIYSFDKEKTDESECYGECAVEWPPVLTKGEPEAKGGVAQGKLATTKRDDGTTQVTYDGKPLYYYFDEGPGELRCHNVPGFGGLWLALDKSGDPV